jgi:hypothetical protein
MNNLAPVLYILDSNIRRKIMARTIITNAQAAKINKMNKASQNVSLGTIVQNVQGGFSFSGSQTSAGSQLAFWTGNVSACGILFQVLRSGSVITNQMKLTAGTAGSYVLTSGSGYAPLASGDILSYMGW